MERIFSQQFKAKQKTINEWIDRDTKKDELYESAVPLQDVMCLKCKNLTTVGSKILYDSHDDDQGGRILFVVGLPK